MRKIKILNVNLQYTILLCVTDNINCIGKFKLIEIIERLLPIGIESQSQMKSSRRYRIPVNARVMAACV